MSSEGMSSGSASGSEENENAENNKSLIISSGDYLNKSDILAALQNDHFEVSTLQLCMVLLSMQLFDRRLLYGTKI